jgi:FKBP-type peptidyl-prolyl cis-trans isomerase
MKQIATIAGIVLAVIALGWWMVATMDPTAKAPPKQLPHPNAETPPRPPSGGKLKIEDITEGSGAAAKSGDTVSVHYTGKLVTGTQFDSSVGREPFQFMLGRGKVIAGWDQGVAGMKVGGKRKLVIPPELAYGETGQGKTIPPNAELHFEVELLSIR